MSGPGNRFGIVSRPARTPAEKKFFSSLALPTRTGRKDSVDQVRASDQLQQRCLQAQADEWHPPRLCLAQYPPMLKHMLFSQGVYALAGRSAVGVGDVQDFPFAKMIAWSPHSPAQVYPEIYGDILRGTGRDVR